MVGDLHPLGLPLGIVGQHQLERTQHCHGARRAAIQVLARAVFEQADVDDVLLLRHADPGAEVADRLRRVAAAAQAYNKVAASFETRVLTSARKLRELDVTTAPELPVAEPIDTAPRVLKQMALMGLPDEATVEPEIT